MIYEHYFRENCGGNSIYYNACLRIVKYMNKRNMVCNELGDVITNWYEMATFLEVSYVQVSDIMHWLEDNLVLIKVVTNINGTEYSKYYFNPIISKRVTGKISACCYYALENYINKFLTEDQIEQIHDLLNL